MLVRNRWIDKNFENWNYFFQFFEPENKFFFVFFARPFEFSIKQFNVTFDFIKTFDDCDSIIFSSVMNRVIHVENDLLTPFDFRARNLGVYRDWSTFLYDSLKKFFPSQKFFSGDFLKNFVFNFYGHVTCRMLGIKPSMARKIIPTTWITLVMN